MTPMQLLILSVMEQHDADDASIGCAAFTGENSRRLGFGVFPAKHGGLVIRAYGTPEYFLKNHGWIVPWPRNVPGIWYRITQAGRDAAVRNGSGIKVKQGRRFLRSRNCGEIVPLVNEAEASSVMVGGRGS